MAIDRLASTRWKGVCRYVFRHVLSHVLRHVSRHVFRHVFRRVYRHVIWAASVVALGHVNTARSRARLAGTISWRCLFVGWLGVYRCDGR